jgi:hypothetical protein
MDENLLPVNICLPLYKEASELTAIFVASRKTAGKALLSNQENKK